MSGAASSRAATIMPLASQALSIAQDVRAGRRSAKEVTRECLASIAERDPTLHAFTAAYSERALAEAAAVDAARAAGTALGPLAGVPYSVKNLFDVKDQVTLAGGIVNRDRAPAKADAVLVARMQSAGAILVGAVNMDEHAYGFTTENSHFGVTRNPLDTERIAGGSSGGSAASVAAGLVPLSLGSDTNGSIRVPASFCGIFGLKPTFGRLPRSGSFPFVHSLDHLGPFARSVGDLALCYDALQGFDANDPACVRRDVEPTANSLSSIRVEGLRIAVLGGHFERYAQDQARAAVARVAAVLKASARVEWQLAEQARAAAFIVTGSEGGALHASRLKTRYHDYEPLSRDRLIAGSLIPARWYLSAQKWRALCRTQLLELFDQFDILLAPATPISAPLIGTEWLEFGDMRLPARPSVGLLTQPISSIGLPVCCVPVWPQQAATSALPVGVQIIAAPWREDQCLAVAHALQQSGLTEPRAAAASSEAVT
jgi:aspartyl-tRNA(Asn)/glutamyl-tRNA(Gln) amidotransferase subunit A